MKWIYGLIVPAALAVLAGPATAGILFWKKGPKPNPKDRVNELIGIVKLDKDEHKRMKAAEELREFDAGAFPDVQAVLIDVLLTDEKPGVRAEAAQSLGKLRPVSQQAGWALEQALAKDSSMKVRLQARSSLLLYHWAGYRGSKKEDPTTTPPPAGNPGSTAPGPRLTPVPVAPPPLPAQGSPEPRRASPTSAPPPLTPAPAPRLQPTPVPGGQGPELIPPG